MLRTVGRIDQRVRERARDGVIRRDVRGGGLCLPPELVESRWTGSG